MKRISFFLLGMLIVLAAISGCDRGPKGPYGEDDEVTIHGKYENEAGTPLAERWVGFWINSAASFFTNFFGLDPEADDKTGDKGEYSETFRGGDLFDAAGTYEVIVMNYDTDWPDTTPRVACLFYPLSTDIEVPTMRFWRGDQTVTMSGNDAVFNWARLSTTHGAEPNRYEFRVKATQDGPYYTLWQEDVGSDTTFTIPGYVLPEGYVKRWHVLAEIDREDDRDFGFIYVSDPDSNNIPDDPYQLLSLGRNCFAEAYADTLTGATDGKWGPWAVLNLANNVSWVYVDLGDTTHTVNAVVMYGATIWGDPSTPGYEVYCSNDTTSWGTAVASNSQAKGYFYLNGFSEQCRYVKLQARDPEIGITGFKEICIFGQ